MKGRKGTTHIEKIDFAKKLKKNWSLFWYCLPFSLTMMKIKIFLHILIIVAELVARAA